jgi:BlaI family penicillinase repressor
MLRNIGPLERRVLDILWTKKEASAREICSVLEEEGHRKAYSTVRTIIKRLVKKKIIQQKIDKQERMYLYTPIFTKNELEKKIVHSVIGDMLKRFEQSTISYLAEELSDNKEDIEKIKQKLNELKKNA